MRALAKFASVAALATASISSANAAVYVFNYAGNNNSSSYGTPGNTITSTASNGSTSVSVTASAWSTVSNVTSAAWLGNYPEGLGVKNAAADQNSVDNYAGLDYVLLQFSRPVSLTSAFLTAKGYPVFGQPVKDADAVFSYGNTAATSLGNIVSSVPSSTTILGTLRTVATAGQTGKFWAIAASGTDRTFDAFKIGKITVSAVPEPATWAMMIIGFGAIGMAMRSRRAKTAKVSYAF
jgi:hypothetical protein